MARSSRAKPRRPLRQAARPDLPGASAHVRFAAFGVHLFTALGAACALLAMLAATHADWVTMFVWLGAALAIDGADGALARRLNVASVLPRWSGDALDLMVDYTTYVFVPAYALAVGGLLPDIAALPLSVAIAVSGAIYCADRNMKTRDHYFLGFPVLWNAVAFHLFVLKLDVWIAAAVIALFLVLTFVPYRTIHPLRVRGFQAANMLAITAWGALSAYALLHRLEPGMTVALVLSALAVYLAGVGIVIPRR